MKNTACVIQNQRQQGMLCSVTQLLPTHSPQHVSHTYTTSFFVLLSLFTFPPSTTCRAPTHASDRPLGDQHLRSNEIEARGDVFVDILYVMSICSVYRECYLVALQMLWMIYSEHVQFLE